MINDTRVYDLNSASSVSFFLFRESRITVYFSIVYDAPSRVQPSTKIAPDSLPHEGWPYTRFSDSQIFTMTCSSLARLEKIYQRKSIYQNLSYKKYLTKIVNDV